MDIEGQKRRNDIILVGGLALILRLIYVSQLAGTPFFDSPIVDAEYHDAWAREILRQGIGHEGVFFRAPLYPYFLALIYSLSDGSFMAARVAQCVLGAITAMLTYLLGWSLTQRRAVALLSGLGAALYGMLVYFDGELLLETLFVPLLLAACWIYAQAVKKPKISLYLLAGVLLGLAAITRPSALVLLPILVIDRLLSGREPGRPIIWRWKLAFAITMVVGCFIPIFPVTWHNVRQGGDFVLIASQGGVNAYIGNNPEADGLHSYIPGLGSNWDVPAASYLAFDAEGRALRPSEVSRYYYKLARRFVFEQPAAWAKLMLKKFCAFWNRLEVSNNRDLYFFRSETRILPVLHLLGFWVIGPYGLLGWWISARRKLLPAWFLWFIPFYMLGVIAFFVTARFRIPVIPFLLICSAVAVLHLFEHRKSFFDLARLRCFALLLVLGVFVNTNPWRFHGENAAHSYFSLGNAYLKSGKLEAARQAYRSALEADSTYLQVHLNLGVLAYQAGDRIKAAEEYREELKLNPKDARALNNLGVLRFEAGRLEEAEELYERALDLQPYYEDARANLAQTLFKLGMEKAAADEMVMAADYFSRACHLDGEKALYHYNYALALGRLGYSQAAVEHLKEAIKLQPDFEMAERLLETIQGGSGDVHPQGSHELP
ncbi:MAG TPA: tetratricopeptide repeat protein [Bacteroidetes bacterium]|nr:tetratricopeptide repeat protein [Bacteroidota bacterium]